MFSTTTMTQGDWSPGFFFGNFFLFFFVFLLLVCVLPFWKIFGKAGFPPALSLLMPIPGVNLVLLYILAFSAWPALRKRPRDPDPLL